MQSVAGSPDQTDQIRTLQHPKHPAKSLPQSDMFRKREAASYLGMSPKTLMKRVVAGEISVYPGPHITSPLQFKKSDLDRYNERRKVTYPKKK